MVHRWCVGREVDHGRCVVSSAGELGVPPAGQYEQLLKITILLLYSVTSKHLLWSAVQWLLMVILNELLL